MDLVKAIFPCLPTSRRERRIQLPTSTAEYQQIFEKATVQRYTRNINKRGLCSDEAAMSIVSTMLDADQTAGGWSEFLANKILSGLEAVLKSGEQMNAAMQKACDKACEAAKVFEGFAADHPVATAVFCTVIAIGVLVVLAPYALEWLGFGELRPIEGNSYRRGRLKCEDWLMPSLGKAKWAAAWQATYKGYVPKKSPITYFQRLGMTWKRVQVDSYSLTA